MNANELADLMEDMYPSVATMLRQLQAENEALKIRIHDAIAWMDVKEWNSVDREILLEIFRGEAKDK